MILSFALPLFLLVVGAVGAVFNIPIFAMLAGLLCFLCSFFVWISVGIHDAVDTVTKDICKVIRKYTDDNKVSNSSVVNGTLTDSTQQIVNQILSCNTGDAFKSIESLATNALQNAVEFACNATEKLCNNTIAIQCPDSFLNNCTKDTLPAFLDSSIEDYLDGCYDSYPTVICPYDSSVDGPCTNVFPCWNVSRTIRECATECNNTDLRTYSNESVVNLDLLEAYYIIAYDEIFPLLNCTTIKNAFDELENELCDTFSHSITKVAGASAALGFFLIPGTILLILGFKRFRANNSIGNSFGNNGEGVEIEAQSMELPSHATSSHGTSPNEASPPDYNPHSSYPLSSMNQPPPNHPEVPDSPPPYNSSLYPSLSQENS